MSDIIVKGRLVNGVFSALSLYRLMINAAILYSSIILSSLFKRPYLY